MIPRKILFCVIPEKGHINPAIGVAQHLQAKGFEVAFFSAANIEEQLTKAGLRQFQAPSRSSGSAPNQGEQFSKQITNPTWLREWIKRMLIDSAPGSIAPLRKAISGFRADLVVTDPMIYPAVIASQLEQSPWVALSNSLNPVLSETIQSELLDTVQWLSPERDELFSAYGLKTTFSGCDAISPLLTIAFTTEEFTGISREGVSQVGPSLPLNRRGDESSNFDWSRINSDLPLIYASFGSQVFHQPEFFLKIIEAVRGKEIQLIAAIHDLQNDPRFLDLPPNVIACGYAPQLEILRKANLLITHGGANSVMEAIATATPVLIQPVCNDQFHQARFVEKANCGHTIHLNELSSDELWHIIHDSLEDRELNFRLAQLAESYQRDGAKEAAELIGKILTK